MRKLFLPALLCAGFLVLAVSCSDEKEQEKCCLVDPELEGFENLTERWHVLNNLESAYNQRNTSQYNRLVDPDDFLFSFVMNRTPRQWGPTLDMNATEQLLLDAINIDVDIVFDKDQIDWHEVTPQDYPNETWYTATVNYQFTMRFNSDPETTYITGASPQAEFTVREYDDNGTMRWRLVEWRDLAMSLTIVPGTSAIEETSWGTVKALFN